MRGKEKKKPLSKAAPWITPAYAGKSKEFLKRMDEYGGSPPPMRGKERFRAVNVLRKGITPAYAGKSTRNASYHKQL